MKSPEQIWMEVGSEAISNGVLNATMTPEQINYAAMEKYAQQFTEWKPVESAPKDETEIIIYDAGSESQYMASWSSVMGNGCWNIGLVSYVPSNVTHWKYN